MFLYFLMFHLYHYSDDPDDPLAHSTLDPDIPLNPDKPTLILHFLMTHVPLVR
jgi:hypothetical protein